MFKSLGMLRKYGFYLRKVRIFLMILCVKIIIFEKIIAFNAFL